MGPCLAFQLARTSLTSARAHNTRYLIGLDLRAHIRRLLCHKGNISVRKRKVSFQRFISKNEEFTK